MQEAMDSELALQAVASTPNADEDTVAIRNDCDNVEEQQEGRKVIQTSRPWPPWSELRRTYWSDRAASEYQIYLQILPMSLKNDARIPLDR